MLPTTAAVDDGLALARSVRTEVIEDVRRFESIRADWNELLRTNVTNGPFLTWEWLHAWWTHVSDAKQLRLFVVYRGDELIAIAPLLAARSRLGLFSQLEFLGTGAAGSDYLDLIVHPNHQVEALGALAREFGSRRCSLHLRHLPPAAMTSLVTDSLVRDGWTTTLRQIAVCPHIPLGEHTFDSYLATLGSAHRANFRRRLKALNAQFNVRCDTAASDAERREALSALIAFHRQRWTDRRGSTAFQEAALQAFHEDATRRALEAGWLRMLVLRLNDVPAAVMYGFLYNRRFYFYQHGFDEQYQRQSVGLVLMGLAIRSAIDEGAVEFDMLYGNEPYKGLWAHAQRPLFEVSLYPPHVIGALHHRFVSAQRTVRALAHHFRSQESAHAA